MPKAKKQKNGSWRCQLWVGEETLPDGKKKQIVKSFTAPTRSEAEDMASEYRRKHGRVAIEDLTLSDAISRYIDSKSNILSPATIRGYKKDADNILKPLADIKISKLTQEIVQFWINDCAVKYSPKSIKNGYGLLASSVTAVNSTFYVNVAFPKKKKIEYYIPSYEEVMLLVNTATAGSNLRKAILLSAFCSLRRGEICALTEEDMDLAGGWVTVSKDMIMDENGNYILKEIPKTEDSNRTAPMPDFVAAEMKTGVVECAPNTITKMFEKLVKKCKLPHIRFHDLRHFFASYLHLHGVSDAYIEKYGGWKPGSKVMKEIYRNTINQEEKNQAQKIKDIFAKKEARV